MVCLYPQIHLAQVHVFLGLIPLWFACALKIVRLSIFTFVPRYFKFGTRLLIHIVELEPLAVAIPSGLLGRVMTDMVPRSVVAVRERPTPALRTSMEL